MEKSKVFTLQIFFISSKYFMPDQPKSTNIRKISRGLIFFSILFALFLAGCASSPENDESDKWAAQKLYKEAKDALDASDYETAIKYFEKLEAKYPFGDYATQAELDTVYAYYKFNEADSSIEAANRFIKLHPRHAHVDYAYYMRGLASEAKKKNALDNYLPQDPSKRDPASTKKAYDYFDELVKKFPNSRYAPDAVKRMGYLRDSLAMHEIQVAKYYIGRNAYVAAINRAKYVVENYPQTPASRIALKILVDSYKQLGMNELAEDAERVLKLNQPSKAKTGSQMKPPEKQESNSES
jgi:outer membrane protein assembly factor BamD